MLVRPHNGGIDDQVFEVRMFAQLGEKLFPNASFWLLLNHGWLVAG
jgi:hypothetical protein